jgi:DNA primase
MTQEQKKEILNKADIVEIVGSYIPLTQKGRNYWGVCPFHDDHSPSMSVSREKQIYTCWSCHATGNVFNFVMDYEKISFMEAVGSIANRVGVKLDGIVYEPKKNDNKLYDIYEISEKFYQNNINTIQGKKARTYLQERKISDEIIKEFGIGLALEEHDLLTKLLIKKNFDVTDIVKSGLSTKNENGINDIYRNRIMFPLWDLNGKIVGYSGRIFNGENTSKYINTKETEIFKKGELLYNYHRAKEYTRTSQTVIVMEGFMDVIRAHTIGINNVIATMGTAMSKQQANSIKRIAKKVILCFDGDEAGQKATYSCGNELINVGLIPSVIRLEDDLDPDDYIKKYGADSFIAKVNNPISIMDFKLSYLKNNKDLTNDIELKNYIQQMLKEISNIDDDILIELSLKKISEETKLDIEFLRSKLDKKEIAKEVIKKVAVTKTSKYEKAELYLLNYMLKSEETIQKCNKNNVYMPTQSGKELAKQINIFYKKYNYINVADLIAFLENKSELIKTIGDIEALDLKEKYSQAEIEDYIKVINEYNTNYAANILQDKVKQETDPTKKAKIAQEILNLRMGIENND